MALDNINRVPRGLLQLLELKTGGITPPRLNDELQAQLDLLPFYMSPNVVFQGALNLLSAGGQVVTLSVPALERWIVQGITAHVSALTMPASGSIDVSFTKAGQSTEAIMGQFVQVLAVPAISRFGVGADAANFPLVAGPGDTFSGTLTALSAGTATLSLIVHFMRTRS